MAPVARACRREGKEQGNTDIIFATGMVRFLVMTLRLASIRLADRVIEDAIS